MSKGLLISFDGIDSSGKATQARRLADRLRYIGWVVHELQTPDYTTESGKELKMRLQGKKGDWHTFPWERKMHLFAVNRAENREKIKAALRQGEIIIYDRYVPSSLAFITIEALLPQDVELYRPQVHQSVEKLEYAANGMPREDVSIFLDVPPAIAGRLLEKRKQVLKDEAEYTDHVHIMERLYNEYDVMCTENPERFLRLRCVEGDELLGIDDTTALIWEALIARFPHIEQKQ